MRNTSTRQHVSHSGRLRRARRRAIAMLLVLVCMAAATISTTAYLASRDNSAVIGENVANAAAARWAASSGLDLALATLEMNADWCSLHTNGVLYNNMVLADALVTVQIDDFIKGEPLANCAPYIRVTSRAVIGGVEQSTGAIVYFTSSSSDSVAVDLSEFAAFVSEQLEVRNNAAIMRWPTAPLSKLGRRVAIGTNSNSTGVFLVRDQGEALDATAYRHPEASVSYLDIRSGEEPREVVLPDRIPFPAAPPIATVPPTVLPTPPTVQVSGTQLIASNFRARRVEVKDANTVLLLQGTMTLVVEQDMDISSSGQVLVDGDVRIIVFGNLTMDQGAIELADNAQLTVFVRGGSGGTALQIKDSYVGNLRATNTIDNTGEASWMDPRRITFFSVAGTSQNWDIKGASAVKASIYAPDASRVRIEDSAALYGRVASRKVELRNNATLFYDPGLNTNDGYTNTESGLYDEDGRLKDDFRLLASLDPLLLEPIASTTRKIIKLGNTEIGDLLDGDGDGGGGDAEEAEQTLYADPVVFGSSVSLWEGSL